MSVHYIVDEEGKQTGVLVSIDEWKQIQEQLSSELADDEIPEWHKEIVEKRLKEYEKNPIEGKPYKQVMDEIRQRL